MEFGLQFFPDVGPDEVPADRYFDECLKLVDECDRYGLTRVRTVEHYFTSYGGYSPNPMIFLAAAAQRTKHAKLVTGAVLPAFNNPLKLAGEIGMLDALTGGRFECGFARAFLPHEFERFGVSLDESVARFDEGFEQVRRLLTEEHVTSEGKFHSFRDVTSLPRPTQLPHPPFWTAAITSIESFEKAGRQGVWIMGIPLIATRLKELCDAYRAAWKAAGHPGRGRVMLAFHMFCHEDRQTAFETARGPLDRYLQSICNAASDWNKGTSSKDYPGYGKLIEALSKETIESQVEKNAAFVGTPAEIIEQIESFDEALGGFEDASLQVNFNDLPYEEAVRSVRLFGEQVMPHFASRRSAAE